MKILALFADTLFFWLPPILGGLVDYCNQLAKGQKKWSAFGFVVHLLSALFFGWLAGTVASGLEYTPDIIYASGGMGGFLGVRMADLLTYKIQRVRGA